MVVEGVGAVVMLRDRGGQNVGPSCLPNLGRKKKSDNVTRCGCEQERAGRVVIHIQDENLGRDWKT